MALFGLQGVALANFAWIVALFVLAGVAFSIRYTIRKNWPIEVHIHADQSGSERLPIVSKDRARLINISTDGDKVLYLRKHKTAKAFHGNYAGRMIVAYAIRNGVWYNAVYGGIDDKLGEIGLEPLDQYHRLIGQAIKTEMAKQYNQPKINKLLLFSVLGALLFVALSGFILYKNMQVNRDTASVNLQIEKERKESLDQWTSAQLNITESIRGMIAYASQFNTGSGARPA